MKIEKASFNKMSPSGSSLLRSLQNNTLPDLDLFVRESIQNSLDAGLKVENYDSVIIDMATTKIDVANLAPHFEGISSVLLERYANKTVHALHISDSQTCGLTGNLDYRKGLAEAGNVYKLIYGISHPQTEEGAGGSWGLGKTVYFRLGIGIVIYYSRIKQVDGSYEERLAATLIEDESKADGLMQDEGKWKRGIAWWGQALDENSTIPITDPLEIETILSTMEIQRFSGEETGTKVIVPFINPDLAKQGVQENAQTQWWHESIEDYLTVAVQRWYAPRLDNAKYKYGKWLDFRVAGTRLTKDKMLAPFLEIQKLYNFASKLDLTTEQLNNLRKKGIFVNPINSDRSIVQSSTVKGIPNLGQVAFKKYSKSELGMVPPKNLLTPYEYINYENASNNGMNSPIVTYTRRPGLLINYALSGSWCNNIEVGENEYLLVVFVPNSTSELKSKEIPNLEEYLRKSENADHAKWSNIPVDGTGTRVVTIIQRAVSKSLASVFKQQEKQQVDTRTAMLGRKLGKLLLPPRGYGQQLNGRNLKRKSTNTGISKATRKEHFKIIDQYRGSLGFIRMDFEIKFSAELPIAMVEFIVASEQGNINANEWEEAQNGIGTAFPLKINNIVIEKTTVAHKLEKVQSENFQSLTKFYVENLDASDASIKGYMNIKPLDPLVQFSIATNFQEDVNK